MIHYRSAPVPPYRKYITQSTKTKQHNTIPKTKQPEQTKKTNPAKNS